MDIWLFIFFISLPIIWFLSTRFPLLSNWSTIALVIVFICVFSWNYDLPFLLFFFTVPILLGVTMIGISAGLGVAVMLTIIQVIIKWLLIIDSLPWNLLLVNLTLNWSLLGIFYLFYRPIKLHYHWLNDYAISSRKYMSEAQSRMVELNYALFSLANANRQLKAVSDRMNALRVIAEDAQKTKTMFLSKVSHEFRTPLNMIIGLVELMVKNHHIYAIEIPPDMEKDLQVIQRNCQHLSSMINDVLDLTRIESGQVVLHKERLRLEELFEETIQTVRPLVDKKNLKLELEIQPDLPELYCDRTRIRQVILNLISNAARFTEKGGIFIKAFSDGNKVEVCVKDTGPGISPEDIEHIFEPFFQGSRGLWRGREGSGLGLSISQQFIQSHDGRLWVESEVDKGSQFYFELPVPRELIYSPSAGQWIRDDWIWREESFKSGRLQVDEFPNKSRIALYDHNGGISSELARLHEKVDVLRIDDIENATKAIEEFAAKALLINAADHDNLSRLMNNAREKFYSLPIIGCSISNQERYAIEFKASGYLIKPITSEMIANAIQKIGHPIQRVLIIDDDPELQLLFDRMLRTYDHLISVESALDGILALNKLAEGSFDLILLDMIMPNMNGWELLAKIQSDDRWKNIPVYIVTAQDPFDRPISSDLLLATINQGISLDKVIYGQIFR